ncbi:cell division protein FtsX [Clostridiales bacterium PH28_bin88]|nr:cell division protein FtsX [Clostridiales bacterium PH28_bin88]
MKPRTIGYFFRQAFISVRRNGWMSVASAATVAIALFILGAFLLLVINANSVASWLESNVEIAVFLDVDAPRDKAVQISKEVAALEGVAEVKLVPKEEGLADLSRRFGDGHDLLAALGGKNPLPDYLRVKAQKPDDVPLVAEAVAALAGVEKVDYGEGTVKRLFSLLAWIRWIGLITMGLVSLAAVFLVAITVRLTVFARRREIGIMKYVGATDWFIRWPFFLEGMFLGMTGSVVAVGALYLSYVLLVDSMTAVVSFLPLVTEAEMVLGLLSWLLLAGTVVGALGSAVSVRRFLRV